MKMTYILVDIYIYIHTYNYVYIHIYIYIYNLYIYIHDIQNWYIYIYIYILYYVLLYHFYMPNISKTGLQFGSPSGNPFGENWAELPSDVASSFNKSKQVGDDGRPSCPMGKPWENHGKTMGKPWENHGKTMGKPWENGKTVGKP